ncbi:MAG: DUF503 domain-containing protein [Phycisphaerales bacterium JB040]
MVVGVLQFELRIPWAESLKDKRRVVRSLKDRLHREHQVSVAEVAALEETTLAVLGLAAVGSDGQRVGEVLDAISARLRTLTDAELAGTRRELLHGSQILTEKADEPLDEDGVAEDVAAMLRGLAGGEGEP